MTAYWSVVSARFRVLLQYRAAAWAGFVTQIFWGALRISVLAAFFVHATGNEPISLAQLVSYVWLGQALIRLLPWDIDAELGQQIRSGAVGYDLLRPLDLYGYWFARTLAYRAAPTAMRMVPLLLVVLLILPLVGLGEWGLQPPPSLAAGLLFFISLAAMLLLVTAITMLMQISLLWTISGEGINRLMPPVVTVFSGMVLPLPLFPDWLQGFLYWQPFRGVGDVPYRIYSGHISALQAPTEILLQCAWGFLLIGLGYWLLQRGLRRMVIQGG